MSQKAGKAVAVIPKHDPDGPGRPPALTPAEVELLIAQIAQKTPVRAIMEQFKVCRATVYRYLKRPEAQELLDTYRAIIKQTMLARTTLGVVHGAFDVVQQAIDDKDAKGLDAATRAVMNLEKVSASASGEGRKIEVTGAGGGPIGVDVRALIADIVAHGAPDQA